HTRFSRDWSSDVCSSDLGHSPAPLPLHGGEILIRSRPLGPPGHSPAPLPLHGGEIQAIPSRREIHQYQVPSTKYQLLRLRPVPRSEERRVGKESKDGDST